MKTLTKIICSILLLACLGSCRKEVHEPPADTRNDNFVFIEIDGEKFMVEDRTWNFNRNTIGQVEDFSSTIDDKQIYLSINFENTKLKRGFGYGQFWLECKPIIGVQRPNSFRLNAKFSKGEDQSKTYNIKIENNKNSIQLNNVLDSLIYITDLNINENKIEFQYATNYYEIMNTDSILRSIKIKAKLNFK